MRIYPLLYRLKRLTIDDTGMGEVKAQLFSVDQGTFLLDVVTEHLSQRGVKQVSGGMIGADLVTRRGIHLGMQYVQHESFPRADRQYAGTDRR